MKPIIALLVSSFFLTLATSAVTPKSQVSHEALRYLPTDFQAPPVTQPPPKLNDIVISTGGQPSTGSSVSMGGNGTDPYFEATEVPKMIERFVSRLKRFVFRGVFNVPAFEYESDDLQTELTQIIGAMKSTDPTEELLSQLRHAKGVFSKMSGSVADLKHYNLSDLPGHEWVYKIIQLNLHLLMMYDSLGNLDTSIPGYVQHVFYSWRNIHVWGMNLRQLNHVPKEIRMLYESQAATAQATINILGEQMSEDSVIETELLHC